MDGNQRQRLCDAILSGFNAADLEQTVRFALDEQLDQIVGPGPLVQVVFELVAWAEQEGRTDQLAQAVRRARPKNEKLQAITQELLAPQ